MSNDLSILIVFANKGGKHRTLHSRPGGISMPAVVHPVWLTTKIICGLQSNFKHARRILVICPCLWDNFMKNHEFLQFYCKLFDKSNLVIPALISVVNVEKSDCEWFRHYQALEMECLEPKWVPTRCTLRDFLTLTFARWVGEFIVIALCTWYLSHAKCILDRCQCEYFVIAFNIVLHNPQMHLKYVQQWILWQARASH